MLFHNVFSYLEAGQEKPFCRLILFNKNNQMHLKVWAAKFHQNSFSVDICFLYKYHSITFLYLKQRKTGLYDFMIIVI